VEQRGVVIYSEKAFKREEESLRKQIEKEKKVESVKVKRLQRKGFACQRDGQKEVEEYEKSLSYDEIEVVRCEEKRKLKRKGRPKEGEECEKEYRIEVRLKESVEKVERKKKSLGKFVIGTNELEESELKESELLGHYKGQGKAEKGLEDQAFFFFSFSVMFNYK
jgi:transposase